MSWELFPPFNPQDGQAPAIEAARGAAAHVKNTARQNRLRRLAEDSRRWVTLAAQAVDFSMTSHGVSNAANDNVFHRQRLEAAEPFRDDER
jgi:hypothetical protein